MCAAGVRGSARGGLARPHPVLTRRPHGLRRRAANDNLSGAAQIRGAVLMVAGGALVCTLAVLGVPILV